MQTDIDEGDFLSWDDEELDNGQHEKEAQWNRFVELVVQGNVIPVIGPDFLINHPVNPHRQLINFFAGDMARRTGRARNDHGNFKSFSQLINDDDWLRLRKPDDIYFFINKVLGKKSWVPSPLLMKFLGTKMFPFVITTSFTGVAERAMKEIWGADKVKVLEFNNDPNHDKRKGLGDIYDERELHEPTVFYMFGKYGSQPHRYVVDDFDMMKFCQKWLSDDGVPRTLTDCIRNRYLLFLGTDYSDWLFRFIWFSMRYSNRNNTSLNDREESLFIGNGIEPSLEQFLNRLQIDVQSDPESAIGDIVSHIDNWIANEPRQTEYVYDVFLSYARSDKAVAEKLYNALKSEGLNVWMDTKGGISKWEDWRSKMLESITKCRLFVPIISKSIEGELSEREYKSEWREANDISKLRIGKPFICPVVENGFDFYDKGNDLPLSFLKINAATYDEKSDWGLIARELSDKVAGLKTEEG